MKKSRSKLLLIGLLCCAAVFFLGYGVYQQENKKTAISVIYIPKIVDSNNDFWTTLIEGAQMAAEEYNVDLTIWSPFSETDSEGQNRLIEKAIEQNPDVLLVSPISREASTELLKRAQNKEKIPVLLVDSDISQNIQTSIVASDNLELGKTMGSYAREYLGEDSKIAIVSHVPGSSTAMEREKGFRAGLQEDEAKIVETVYSYSDFQLAYQVTKELLEKYPDITLIAGMNEYSAVGAGRAIRELGMNGKIRVIGVDNSLTAVQMLEEGIFSAIVIQKPFNMGYLSVVNASKIARGMQVERKIDSGTQVITRENMYTEEGQKALFSFLNN